MNCPNCDYEIITGNTCPHCGVDTVLFVKTTIISDSLYNKGLEMAQNRDLSGAISSLTKSIEFNKNNIQARNLLGLVYFEFGRIGDALKQWVISQSLSPEENLADEYIKKAQNDGNALEKYNESIRMYNQALSYLRQKSDDMAIIQLKKALEYNPRFVDAMNLLTFCYCIQKEKDLSLNVVNRVLAVDVNNHLALNYYKEIVGKTRTVTVKRDLKAQKEKEPAKTYTLAPKSKTHFNNNFYFWEIVCFIFGGLCVLALCYILIIPAMIGSKDTENADLLAQVTSLQTELEDAQATYNENMNTIRGEYDALSVQNQELTEQVNRLERNQRLISIGSMIDENNLLEAAAMLNAMDTVGMADDVADIYEGYKEDTYPTACVQTYNEGVSLYQREEYDEAILAFNRALIYSELNTNYTDDILYYLGLIAEEKEDYLTARNYYETILEEYPNSNIYNSANRQLNNLPDSE